MNALRGAALWACAGMVCASVSADVRVRFVDPTVTHPDIRVLDEFDDGSGRNLGHILALDRDLANSGKLFLFLPGSGALPDDYERVAEHAAAMGHHVVSLAYPNIPAVVQLMDGETDPNLPGAIRRERLFGDPVSDMVQVERADSVAFRLARLLEYAEVTFPNGRWGQFLDGDLPRWESIIVGGHSQGSGHASYLAHEFNLAGVALFAGPGDRVNGAPATWVLRPLQTDPTRIFAFIHIDDRGVLGALDNQEILGLDAFGGIRVIDEDGPPFGGRHQLITQREPDPGANPHNMIIADAFLPVGADGVTPVYTPVWSYVVGVPGDVNRDNVVTLTDLAIILTFFGEETADPTRGDVTADGRVDLSDLALVLSNFGVN